MNKVTIVKNENFTTVSNIPLQNKDLSWKAKGLLMYLMTLPPSWKVQLSDLENRSTDGRDSTNGAIKELMEHGYISRVPVTEKGKFKGYDYTVFDEPNTTATGFPQRFTRDGSPATGKPSLLNIKEVNTKEEKEPLTPIGENQELFPTKKDANDQKLSKVDNMAIVVLAYLNAKTGKKPGRGFDSVKGTGFVGHVKSGKTFEDFKAVIDFKIAQWGGDPKMSSYLRPSTLFGGKFTEYLIEADNPTNSTPLFTAKEDPDDSWRFKDPLAGRLL